MIKTKSFYVNDYEGKSQEFELWQSSNPTVKIREVKIEKIDHPQYSIFVIYEESTPPQKDKV